MVAIDDKEQITELVRYALQNYPNLHVQARAIDRDHVYHLYAAGCRDIIRETYDSSLRMGRSAFEALGLSRDQADAMTEAFQEMDRDAMISVADVYDVTIPPTENEAYLARIREVLGPWQDELGAKMKAIAASGSLDMPSSASSQGADMTPTKKTKKKAKATAKTAAKAKPAES